MPTNRDTLDECAKQLHQLRREIAGRGFEPLCQDLMGRLTRYDGPTRPATDAWWKKVLGEDYLTLSQHEDRWLVYDYVTAFSLFQDLKQAYRALAEAQERDKLFRWRVKQFVKKLPDVMGMVSGASSLVEALLPGTPPSAELSSPSLRFTNRIGMKFVWIPAGVFLMGSPGSDREAHRNEKPRHRVHITRAFYLGKYPVTQAQWQAVMGNNPSRFKGDLSRPVDTVSWNDAQEFIRKLNRMEGNSRYRLPTEAEWEYACRADSATRYGFGNKVRRLGEYAWYEESYQPGGTQPVGQKRPNAWDLYDMHGNVWEWVQDRYGEDYYPNSPVHDPEGPATGARRVLRGGDWSDPARHVRSAVRDADDPGDCRALLGFRCLSSGGEPASGA